MAYMEWSDDYLVHIRVIDTDHKALFEIVNALHDRIICEDPFEKIKATFKALVVYVNEHFAREELYLQECGYPYLKDHREKHDKLAKTVHGYYKLFQESPEQFDQEKFLTFLKKWLSNHILQSDMHYVPYIRGEKQGIPIAERQTGTAKNNNLKTVTVQVPQDKVDTLKKCADILNNTGSRAEALEELISKQ